MLEALISQLEASRTPPKSLSGNIGNMGQNSGVTARAPAIAGGNAGNIGNTPKDIDWKDSRSARADSLPLADPELAELINHTANLIGIDPLALWCWLDLDSIEALRGGDPADIRAFQYAVSLPAWDSTPPTIPHGLPFPGPTSLPPPFYDVERAPAVSDGGERVRCCDCWHRHPIDHPALIECGAGRPAPGACGYWWGLDFHICPSFARRPERLG